MKKTQVLLLLFAIVAFPAPAAVCAAEEATYVGDDVCQGCHPELYNSYMKTIHANKEDPGTPATQHGCESCHGPGSEHVARGGGRGVAIFAFNRETPAKAKSEKCRACHGATRQQRYWDMSKHKAEDVSCSDCHNPHKPGDKLLAEAQPYLCFNCHKDIKTMANKQSHHPLKEGKVMCTDCHDPHGAFGQNMIRADSINELCYKCHAEKRGPFMWEHPPVDENCANCHNPHGSNHDRLLVMKVPQLCQQCHDGEYHPGTPYTQFSSFQPPAHAFPAPQLVGRACLNCHTDVHGTNGPSAYGQRFLK